MVKVKVKRDILLGLFFARRSPHKKATNRQTKESKGLVRVNWGRQLLWTRFGVDPKFSIFPKNRKNLKG